MYIQTDKSGRIISIDKDTYPIIDYVEENMDLSSITSGKIKLNSIQICISTGSLQYIALPAYYRGEIYYVLTEYGYLFSDSLFYITSKMKTVTLNAEMSEYFKNKGYCPIGKTFINEIGRLSSNSLYTFDNEELVTKGIDLTSPDGSEENKGTENDEKVYSTFKKYLNESIDCYYKGSNSGILLSGGVDSRLLLVLLKERSDNIKIVTGLTKPFFYENCSDVIVASKIAKLVGSNIDIAEFDYSKARVEDLDKIIRIMPQCVHTGLNFYQMCALASQYDGMTLFCGQNMDTLYNLGPTERFTLSFHGIAQWFKRFYLSEEYFQSLDDVEVKAENIVKITAGCGLKLFKRTTHNDNLRLPRNSAQLIDNFNHSSVYTVFTDGSKELDNDTTCERRVSPFEVKKELYQIKLSYLKGGDSQAVETAGFLNGIDIALPYSNQIMVDFLNKLHLTKKDVWHPKRYSYKYLKEFEKKYGKNISSFAKPDKNEIDGKYPGAVDLYKQFDFIFSNTEFGNGLKEGAGINPQGFTGLMKYDSLLRAFWFNRVVEIIKENGTEVLCE